MDDPKPPSPPPDDATAKSEKAAAKPPLNSEERRKIAGRIISIAVIVGVVVLIFWVWSIVERHPRTAGGRHSKAGCGVPKQRLLVLIVRELPRDPEGGAIPGVLKNRSALQAVARADRATSTGEYPA